MKLSKLGEFGLIEFLTGDLVFDPGGVIKGIGDDTAVLEIPGGKWLLFTTDMMVEGVHFELGCSNLRQVGWKTLAVNLSDIAAMGGRPTHALVSLAVSPRFDTADLAELYDGLREAARTYKVNIVGGDTVRDPDRLVLNVALLGEVEAGKAVYRSGARPSDRVYVTGPLGAPAAGLYLFKNPTTACPPGASDYCRCAHAAPAPRVDAGMLLARSGVTAMDDISDGLASELHEICGAGGVGCLIRQEDIPVDARVRLVAEGAGVDPCQWALYGGEDLELLFTASPGDSEMIERETAGAGIEVFHIGEITDSGGVRLVLPGGKIEPLPRGGYDHFL